jgi:hypothetical protein
MPAMTTTRRIGDALGLVLGLGLTATCGDNLEGTPAGIAGYYPELPAETGEPQAAFAGEITAATASELLTGPSATGMLGDFFIKNDVASFTISAPERVLAVVPTGGNLIDMALLDDAGAQATPDQFGELSLLYRFGRTCEHDSIEILRDGSGGGVAAIRAHGRSGNNDFINIKGIDRAFAVTPQVDPTIDDGVECATTYVLAPGQTTLQTYFTLYNPTEAAVIGPYGTLSDSGGEIESWGNGRGFERASLTDINSLASPAPIDYVVYQAPSVGYSLAPRLPAPAAGEEPNAHSAYLIAGVSLMLWNNESLFNIFAEDKYFLSLPAGDGDLQRLDVTVGADAGALDEVYRAGAGQALADVGRHRSRTSTARPRSAPGSGSTLDVDGDGDVDDAGRHHRQLLRGRRRWPVRRQAAGRRRYLLRRRGQGVGRSQAVAASAASPLEIPAPCPPRLPDHRRRHRR